jgi:hypothetical protein
VGAKVAVEAEEATPEEAMLHELLNQMECKEVSILFCHRPTHQTDVADPIPEPEMKQSQSATDARFGSVLSRLRVPAGIGGAIAIARGGSGARRL